MIELLVVVTVIVVLLALLAPALDKAVEAAGKAVCMTRMRGLNTAVTFYALDHKRCLPEWLAVSDTYILNVNTGQQQTDGETFWWWRLHKYGYVRDPALPGWRFEVGPSSTSSPFACPDSANHNETGPGSGAANNPNLLPQWIAYNIFLGFDNANPPGGYWDAYRHVRLTRVTRPFETFMFSDGHRGSLNGSAGVRGDYILSFNPPATEWGYANLTKHNGTANYGFIDGHTENLSKEEAEDRADQGHTGAPWKTEHFFLPFAHPARIAGR